MILIIDNYDSFTYNIVQYAGNFCQNIVVKKNDNLNLDEIDISKFSHIIISPGPGGPSDSGISSIIIDQFFDKIPILGICLGHQVIGELFGCQITNAENIMHGKVSKIEQSEQSILFSGVPKYFNATRYHSLVVDKPAKNNELIVNAWLPDGTVMGIEHENAMLYGVQFHPESIETEYGKEIIGNFLNIV